VSFGAGTTAEYDLVVGADGVYSTVRALSQPQARATYIGESYWRTVVAPRPAYLSDWTVTFCANGNLVVIPIDRDRVYLTFG
jgi:2-polyprenyl-6-methoxyphenol hydroxylase-like FAD-dependent oxidoreductase